MDIKGRSARRGDLDGRARPDLARNRKFESGSLQRRVTTKPVAAAMRFANGMRIKKAFADQLQRDAATLAAGRGQVDVLQSQVGSEE